MRDIAEVTKLAIEARDDVGCDQIVVSGVFEQVKLPELEKKVTDCLLAELAHQLSPAACAVNSGQETPFVGGRALDFKVH